MNDLGTTLKFKVIDDRYKPCGITDKQYSVRIVEIPDDTKVSDVQWLLDEYTTLYGLLDWRVESVKYLDLLERL